MRIETASTADMPLLCSLFNEARATNHGFPPTHYSLVEFLQAVEGEHVLVYRKDNGIAGFASVWVPERFLHHLYVSPRYQCRGIGGELLKHCAERFGLPMSLKCLESNREACRFYEKWGWHASAKADGPEGRYVLYVRDGADSLDLGFQPQSTE